MIIHFAAENDEFRAFMLANPQARVVVRYGIDGSCDVDDQHQTIEGEVIQDSGDQ